MAIIYIAEHFPRCIFRRYKFCDGSGATRNAQYKLTCDMLLHRPSYQIMLAPHPEAELG